jgi:hypothetical protein
MLQSVPLPRLFEADSSITTNQSSTAIENLTVLALPI